MYKFFNINKTIHIKLTLTSINRFCTKAVSNSKYGFYK